VFQDHDDSRYAVLRDAGGQYAIWPADRSLPHGWTPDGTTGTKTECLDHIRALWAGLRPTGTREDG